MTMLKSLECSSHLSWTRGIYIERHPSAIQTTSVERLLAAFEGRRTKAERKAMKPSSQVACNQITTSALQCRMNRHKSSNKLGSINRSSNGPLVVGRPPRCSVACSPPTRHGRWKLTGAGLNRPESILHGRHRAGG